MRVVVAPDSFKGSASGVEAAEAISAGLRSVNARIDTDLIPMADGGEGTVDAALRAIGGTSVSARARDPLDREISARYGWIAERRLAVIEMAAASGLPLLADELNPSEASTAGTGDLIRDALDRGAETVILGIGGSATVDAGTGFMTAFGVRFLDSEGRPVRGAGGSLERIAAIDLSAMDPRLRNVRITIASDVASPLLGPSGAVHVFGPQKGVEENQLDRFEAGMARFAEVVVGTSGIDHRETPGSGAAGGIGFLMRSFLDITVQDGFSLISETAGLSSRIAGADLAITGEGRLDAQSLVGKVPVNVARLARAAGVPAVAFAGRIEGDPAVFRDAGLALVLPIADRPLSLAEAMADGPRLIEAAAARFMATLQLGGSLAGRR